MPRMRYAAAEYALPEGKNCPLLQWTYDHSTMLHPALWAGICS